MSSKLFTAFILFAQDLINVPLHCYVELFFFMCSPSHWTFLNTRKTMTLVHKSQSKFSITFYKLTGQLRDECKTYKQFEKVLRCASVNTSNFSCLRNEHMSFRIKTP